MKIEHMRATFGTLQGAELDLSDGLNIIQAPNESGKSTWCAFLRTMFYGVSTADREKLGYLPDKARYAPWNGGAMQGSMQLRLGDKRITLERTGRPSAPMQKLIAVYTGTFDKVDGLDGAGPEAGAMLTGVSEDVFTRTAFLGQSGAKVAQTPELERRIGALVSTGDEGASATEVIARLHGWRRGLQNGRGGGSLTRTERELEEQRAQLRQLETRSGDLEELRRSRQRLEEQVSQLEQDLDIHKELESRAEIQRILDAEKRAKQAAQDVETQRERLKYQGRPVTSGDLSAIRDSFTNFETLANNCLKTKELCDQAEEGHAAALEAKSQFSFADLSQEQAAEAARQIEDLSKAAQAEPTGPRYPWLKYIPLGLAVVALVLGLLLRTPQVLLPCAGVILLCVAAYFFLHFRKVKTPAHDALKAALDRLSYPSAELFLHDAAAYSAACTREATVRAAAEQVNERFQRERDEAKAAADAALAAAQALEPQVQEVKEIPALLKKTEEAMEDLRRAETELAGYESAYQTLRDNYKGEMPTEELSYLPMPMRDREDTESALERARNKLGETVHRLAAAQGAIQVSGDPAVINGQIERLEASVAADREKLDALDLAIGTVEAASAQLQTRFSPILGKRASEYMSRLTGGRYDTLAFDRAFDAAVRDPDGDVSHSALYLSAGTVDQLYLSLRLAMCDLLLGGEDPCPIVLDDALANFDDERAEAALRVLNEAAQTRQILLFTCHSREAAIAGVWPGVRVLSADQHTADRKG